MPRPLLHRRPPRAAPSPLGSPFRPAWPDEVPRRRQAPRRPPRRRTASLRRGWKRALQVSLPALLAGLTAISCQRHLKPPPASFKPAHYRPAALRPTPVWPRPEPNPASQPPPPANAPSRAPAGRQAALQPPAPAPPKVPSAPAGPSAAAAALREQPPPVAVPYDPQQPCFSKEQMSRARSVLFSDDAGPWGERWLHAINAAFYELHVPCRDDDFLVLVLTTIQLESGVTVDPALENPNLDALFTYQLHQLRENNPITGKLLDYSGLDAAMHAKLRADTRKGFVRTEGELVHYVEHNLRDWLRDYLHTHYFVPKSLARYAAREGLPNPIHTLGPMQVNVRKAYENARRRGDPVHSEAEMDEWLLSRKTAMRRGIKEGVYQLWRIYRFYRRYLPPNEAVRYTTADYNAGEFSSRNAAFQQQVATLTGQPLALDGDLLAYRNGQPQERVSDTEAAVITLLTGYAAPDIRQDLLLEKTPAFSSTRTARQVCARYHRRTGKPCALAEVPVGAVNPTARIKLGRAYSPVNYSRAYVRRWEENLARYQQS